MSLDVVRGRISNINATNELVEMVSKGEIDASQIPEVNSLVKLFLNNKSDGEDTDEIDE